MNDDWKKILRINLSTGNIKYEPIDDETLRKYIGGYALGAKLLYDEVPPGLNWSDPDNRLMFLAGVLTGTPIPGSGGITICTKGALTGGAAATQAQGIIGVNLKRCGYLGIIINGVSDRWTHLVIDEDGNARLENADHLLGKDTWDTVDMITGDLKKKENDVSILCIGPAGEKLVRWSGIVIDRGHAAMHNGVGAVMGSKKLKAVTITRGRHTVTVKETKKIQNITQNILKTVKAEKGGIFYYGTLNGVHRNYEAGTLPVKNYNTNIWDISEEQYAKFSGPYMHDNFQPKRVRPCWACPNKHCQMMTITEGPYKGMTFEEPEYEQMSALSSNLGINDVVSVIMLGDIIDRLGLDVNEAGWTCACVMECFEKGILTANDLDGLEMRWGNVEAVRQLIFKIAKREGIGDMLAEGVQRAVHIIGDGADSIGIYTLKSNTPRSHDHRARWHEMFDTCVSESGALESDLVSRNDITPFGVLDRDPFDPDWVARAKAKTSGAMQLEDSAITCRFNTRMNVHLLTEAISAVMGWNFSFDEGIRVGRRAVNTMRAYNIRSGITGKNDRPSRRYASTPKDGPAKGQSIESHFDRMVNTYYTLMGWNEQGIPLPNTLRELDLETITSDLQDLL